MTTSNIDICAQALSLLRASVISSFNDDSNEANICQTHYDDFAEDILTRYPWSFATKKILLNQDATSPVNEYTYAHIIPGEALRIWAVFNSSEVGAKPIMDYDIQTIDGGRRIFSNHAQLWAEYTVYTDEANWPPYFKQFAIHALAALIAMPVTDQPDVADRYHALAWGARNENEQGGKFGVAKLIDAQQKPGEMIVDSPLIAARFS